MKKLIMERFDIFANRGDDESSTTSEHVIPSTETTNGHGSNGAQAAGNASPTPSSTPSRKRAADSDDLEEPASQKRRTGPDVDADAVFAAKLQAEENKRARPTRGSATRKTAPTKKKSKSKTAKKARAEDDSDLDSGSETGRKKEVNRSGGFHVSKRERERDYLVRIHRLISQKPLNLSGPLSELLGGEIQVS